MARIRVARGSRTNLPGALDENTLLYGEMYWEREQLDTSDGVLYMGKPDGVVDGENDQNPLAIAGARAMRSLYFQGLWDPSGGAYPADAQKGDIYVAEADGTGAASTFKYGDWAVCIGNDGGSSQWLKSINQAITTEDPLGHDRNPLQLNEGILKLKYDPATLKLNANGELTVSHTEVYTTETGVQINAGQPVALDITGKAIVADCTDVDTAIVIGLAVTTAAPGDFVTVQRSDLVPMFTDSGDPTFEPLEIGAPVYLYINGTYTQDVEDIQPGFVLQQVGIAADVNSIDVHIGTPFQIDASSDIYYIPLTQTITPGDTVHAPSSAAVHTIVQQLTNIESEVVTKTDTGTQMIAGSLNLVGDLTANDVHVSANSIYLGEAKLSSVDGVMQVVNTNLPEVEQTPIDLITAEDLLAINQDIIPDSMDSRNLGDTTHRFNNLNAKYITVDGWDLALVGGVFKLNGNEIVTTANQGAVVQNLIPATSNNIDLGSDTNKFKSAFVGTSLKINTATLATAAGVLQIDGDDIVTDSRLLDLDQNIIPDSDNTRDLGSLTNRFANIYTEEMHVGASSLYVNGKKVISDIADTMTFATDIDQAMTIRTSASVNGSGNGNLLVRSDNNAELLGLGGVDITVPSTVAGKDITFSNASVGGNIRFNGDVVLADDVAITGNLTVSGNVTQLNTTQVNISDNMIQVNSDQAGVPASTLVGGIEVNRGDSVNYRFVFEELTDTFRVGQNGATQAVATRKDDMGTNGNIPTWDTPNNQFQNTLVTISGNTISGNLSGNVTGAVTGNASSATKLATARTISLGGDVTGSITFDGTADKTLTVVIGDNSHNHTSANISDATALNTANKIVERDASGNFSAGNITAANFFGTATKATELATARTIDITGDITATAVAFDGSANIAISAAVNNNSHTHTSANISDATNGSVANMIVKRDGSGNFSAGTITANITGNVSGSSGSCTGIATKATQLYINNDDTGDANCPILFSANTTAGYKAIYEDSAIYVDNTNNNIHAAGFTGALTGNASTATQASKVTVTSSVADANYPVVWNNNTNRLYDTAAKLFFNPSTGSLTAEKVYNAVWNDIADFIPVGPNTTIEYGKVFVMDAEENYGVAQGYCPAGIIGIASDTYGFGVGQKQNVKQIPIAIGGFVLAHVDKKYAPGTPLTATAQGKLTEIKIEDKRDYPERIVATYWKSESEAHWNGVLVNGRHWVKVK